jgi:hypothetical protein
VADLSDLRRDWSNRVNRLQAAVVVLSQSYAGRIEAHMKANRRWTDRTANARNRLFGRATFELGTQPQTFSVGIVAGHGMDYGIYLELGTRFMRIPPMAIPPGSPSVVPATGLVGYPIVGPTLELYAPRFAADVQGLLGRI